MKLAELNSPLHTFESEDNIEIDTFSPLFDDYKNATVSKREKFVKSMDSDFVNFPTDKTLALKLGAQVILTKNISVLNGLVNGSRGKVIGFKTEVDSLTKKTMELPIVEFLVPSHSSSLSSISSPQPINMHLSSSTTSLSTSSISTLSSASSSPSLQSKQFIVGYSRFESDAGHGITLVRCQIPLKLGWALTIHKSQGMTLDQVEIDMPVAFAEGQAYVALSRVKGLSGLSLTRPLKRESVKASPVVRDFYQRFHERLSKRQNAVDNRHAL